MAVARFYDHDRGEWVLLAAGRDGAPGASSWDDLTGKPVTFPPTIGTTATTAAAGNHTHTPASIGAAPASHTHSEYATTQQMQNRTPEIRVVSSLPASPLPGVVYLVTG